MPEIQVAEKIATSQSVFAILFIIALFVGYRAIKSYLVDMKQENEGREQELKDMYKEHSSDAKERETKLMDFLDKSTESQNQTVVTLTKIEGNLDSLAKRMDEGFNDVWTHFEKIDSKVNKEDK